MKCQEVIELMHRDLDRDLSEEESKMMHDHLSSCDGCTEMYERLRQLSEGLIQLPKVEPPYSIVDRIMPELERIDREQITENQASVTWFKRLQHSASIRMMTGLAASVVFIVLVASGSLMNFGPSSENAQIADSTAGNIPGEPEIVYFAENHSGDAKESAEQFNTFTTHDQMAEKRSSANDSGDLTGEQVPPAAASDGLTGMTTQNSAPAIESPADEEAPTVQFMGVRDLAMQPEYPSPNGNYTAQVQLNEQGDRKSVV